MVRFGIIGLGSIATKFANDLKIVDGVQLYAVGSRNLGKAKEFAVAHDALHFYGSYDALLKDKNVDIVYIATPHHLHFENTMSALHAGKSVICEKPFAMNAGQVEKMISLAREKELFLMEAMWTRFIPATLKVKEFIANKIIGEVKLLEADFGFIVPQETPGRLTDPAMGGGTLLDIGIYPVFLSLFLCGNPMEINAYGQLYNNTDRQCIVSMKYKNCCATLKSSFECHLPIEATIYGTQGSIKMHRAFHQCSKLTITHKDETSESLEIPYQGLGYVHEIEEVRDCINNNQLESDKMTWADSLELIKTLDIIKDQLGIISIN
jgi:predicted dehydrogenase